MNNANRNEYLNFRFGNWLFNEIHPNNLRFVLLDNATNAESLKRHNLGLGSNQCVHVRKKLHYFVEVYS